AGYFSSENRKYSCIVVIHKPSTKKGYYGADVYGPAFNKSAQNIFTDTQMTDGSKSMEIRSASVEKGFENYFDLAQHHKTIMPDVTGMPTMDALALLENMGLKVKMEGVGIVKRQSIQKGIKVQRNQTVVLEI